MKKLFGLILVLVASLASANAQGTFQFVASLNGQNEVPPNSSTGFGTAQITLTGSILDVFVDVGGRFTPIGGFIHGPATPGGIAPVLFDLGNPFERPPIIPLDPGGYEFVRNGTTLSSSQISDLMNGLWYINVTSSAFPNGEIRGQIQPVPEPSALTFMGLSSLAVLLLRHRIRPTAQTRFPIQKDQPL